MTTQVDHSEVLQSTVLSTTDQHTKPSAPVNSQHYGFTLKSWPLAYTLWLGDHIEMFWYLTYDEGNYQPDKLTLVYESEQSLRAMLIKLPLE